MDNTNNSNNETEHDVAATTAFDAKKLKIRKLAVKTHIKAAQSKCRYTVDPK